MERRRKNYQIIKNYPAMQNGLSPDKHSGMIFIMN
jgi:hypothetical protein